jgi:hypothetical protein
MKTKAKTSPVTDERRQLEAAKTSRLRALRLAKEAADKEAAAREAAANPAKLTRRRVPAASQRAQVEST